MYMVCWNLIACIIQLDSHYTHYLVLACMPILYVTKRISIKTCSHLYRYHYYICYISYINHPGHPQMGLSRSRCPPVELQLYQTQLNSSSRLNTSSIMVWPPTPEIPTVLASSDSLSFAKPSKQKCCQPPKIHFPSSSLT